MTPTPTPLCEAPADLPQFADEALSSSGQISGINGDEVIRCLAFFPLPASQEKHLQWAKPKIQIRKTQATPPRLQENQLIWMHTALNSETISL